MIKMTRSISRRSFLQGLGLTSAGICLGISTMSGTSKALAAVPPAPGFKPNAFLHIDLLGKVTIVCHRSEMGQGIRSSLPVLLADELGADMKQVHIIQADGDAIYGDQNTDGSNSIRGFYQEMRKAAATARTMLQEAAAKSWKVSPEKCFAEDNWVHLKGTGKKISFGKLALKAGQLPVPEPASVQLRPDKELRRVGKKLPLIDGPAYVQGTAIFGADVKWPGMLIAVMARPPVAGGKVKTFDAGLALKIPGVRTVIEVPVPTAPFAFQPWGGVAVLADNTWAAMRGRDQLKIEWDHGPNQTYDSTKYRQYLTSSAAKKGTPLRSLGDVEKALASAEKIIEAEYYAPHIGHVPMEPPVALAKFDPENGGTCEIWAPTQYPQSARTEVARVLGIAEEKVTVHVTLLGGAFGRKAKADFVCEAAILSKLASNLAGKGIPVRVQWTREDDIQNDYLHSVSAQHMTAGIDKEGKVVAWRHRTAFPPIGFLFDEKTVLPGLDDLQMGVLDVPLDIPNILAEACEGTVHVRVGWLRSVYNIFHAFAINGFMDEIAHFLKKDPRDFMLETYGPARKLVAQDLGVQDFKNYGASMTEHPVNGIRLRAVIERVTKNADWSNKRIQNKGTNGLGLAAHSSFLSYVAVVASVTKKSSGELWVDEAWVVIDAGFIINPDRVKAQMEGSFLNGVGYLLYGGVTHKNGAIEQSNFDDVKIVRMNEAPRKIHVEIISSQELPGGVGEPGLPPVAPAVANAIFALTGKRIREFAHPDLAI